MSNKSLRVLAIGIVVSFFAACKVYTPVQQPAEVLFADDISDYIGGYDIYYHSTNGVYSLQDAKVKGDTIYGIAVKVDSASHVKKNDMSIFAKEDVVINDSTQIAIHKSEISNVEMMGRDGRASFLKSMSSLSLLLVIIISAILIGGLIGLSVWASAASSDGSNASSDQSSDSGSSNSGSDSGTSDSGSSGSGCYVATMVYGSYEADEVWVLRRFRDNVLQKSRGGRWFINWYYSWSPGFVAKYGKYKFIHRVAKSVLQPLVWLLK